MNQLSPALIQSELKRANDSLVIVRTACKALAANDESMLVSLGFNDDYIAILKLRACSGLPLFPGAERNLMQQMKRLRRQLLTS